MSEKLINYLATLRAEAKEKSRQFWEDSKSRAKAKRMYLAPSRYALRQEYEKWLYEWLVSGGEITHIYNYPFPADRFTIVQEDTNCRPKYGSRSENLIIPPSCKFLGGKLGHNEIYYYEHGIPAQVGGTIPLYSNILTDLSARGVERITSFMWKDSNK